MTMGLTITTIGERFHDPDEFMPERVTYFQSSAALHVHYNSTLSLAAEILIYNVMNLSYIVETVYHIHGGSLKLRLASA